MKKHTAIILLLWLSCTNQPAEELSVFISVDMEGIAGVISSRECSPSGDDYQYFRRLMTLETNAAIEGAFDAGARHIVVRDGHGAKNNILPELLDNRAELIRGVTDRPENMLLGLDSTFDALICIGYHAKGGTPDGIVAHTSSGNVIDLSINGISMPELGYNAVIAGLQNVPVILVAGDNLICKQAESLLGTVTVVETKEGFGTAARCLHPEVVRSLIRRKVTEALAGLNRYKPFKLIPPYQMVLDIKKERSLYPGATKTATGKFVFTHNDFLKVMDAFNKMK